MNYYHCSTEQLHTEAQRRGYAVFGTRDELAEALQRGDDEQGTDATTVKTEKLEVYAPRDGSLSRTAQFGQTPADTLVGERIVYWTMNTFFPTLQLFFASGRSCTIEGGPLPGAMVGLDAELRFRLTDCTYDEKGRLAKSLWPDKFSQSVKGLLIKEVVVAERTSIALRMDLSKDAALRGETQTASLEREAHMVVGIRLEGMRELAYVWARIRPPKRNEAQAWGDVRIGAFRNDIPSPLVVLPLHTIKPGGEVILVDNRSQIRDKSLSSSRGRRLKSNF